MRIDNWFEAKIKITKIGLLQLFLTSLDALLSTSPKQQDIYIGDGNIDTCLFKMETLYYTVFSSFIIIKIMIIDHFFVNFDNFKMIKDIIYTTFNMLYNIQHVTCSVTETAYEKLIATCMNGLNQVAPPTSKT